MRITRCCSRPGNWSTPFFYAGFLALILSFPSGRLRGRLDRALIVVTIVLVAVINPAGLLFTDPRMLCRNCPANLLEVARQDTAMMGATYLVRVGAIAVALTGIGLLVGRWRRASRPQRRAVMPVVMAGAVAFTAEDDGTGFDPATTPMGTGLQGIADRLGALGGTIDFTSTPGHGTRVTGRVPAAAR